VGEFVADARRRIVLTAIAPAEESLLESISPILSNAFHARIEISQAIPLPGDAYNRARHQYRSTPLLDVLARAKQAGAERQLGVTDVDLFVPELNFVFGEADGRRGVAVFSTARLHAAARDRFVHRAATEAIHELAHTYGLGHCADDRCVMWFSNTLEETDRKGTEFCSVHADALERALAPLRGSRV
jgi:archaemetzincin